MKNGPFWNRLASGPPAGSLRYAATRPFYCRPVPPRLLASGPPAGSLQYGATRPFYCRPVPPRLLYKIGILAAILLFAAGFLHLHAQQSPFPGVPYNRGQDVSPTFDGCDNNPDASFSISFR